MHSLPTESDFDTRFRGRFAVERSPILTEIDVYLRKVVELRTRLNTFTDINQLPTELLAKIFVAYAQDHYQSTICDRTSRSTGPHWIKLAHVCRHWREVALGTPRFWSHVHAQQPRILSALLPLSKSSPLHIDVEVPFYRYDPLSNDPPGWLSASELIGQASHRLQELRCALRLAEFRTLAEKLSHPMPLLEKLVLRSRVYQDEDALQPLHLIPTPGHTPRLRHLELRQLPFTWIDAIFCSGLTTLVVARKAHQYPGLSFGTFEQFLDALQAIAPTLVHLTLEESVPQLQSPTTEPTLPSGGRRSITLSSLQTLRIVCNTNDCVHLMDHLSVNPEATMDLTGREGTGLERLTAILATHFSRSTPLLALRIALSRSTPWVAIRGDENKYKLSEHPDSAYAKFRLTFPQSRMNHRQLLTAVLSSANTLFSNVHTLYLHTDSVEGYHIDWLSLFVCAPLVETLDIVGHPGKGFLEALSNVQEEADSEQGQSPATSVPLNHLRILKLRDARFRSPSWRLGEPSGDSELSDQLIDWAILRCNYGVPLERLELSACTYATAEIVGRVEEVIGEVDWDGWERESTEQEYSDSSDS